MALDYDPYASLYGAPPPSPFALPEDQEDLFLQEMLAQQAASQEPQLDAYAPPDFGEQIRPMGDRVVVKGMPAPAPPPAPSGALGSPLLRGGRGSARIGETVEAGDEIAAPGSLDAGGVTPEGDAAIEIDPISALDASGTTPEGDAGIEIDPIGGIDTGGVTPEGDAGIEIDPLDAYSMPAAPQPALTPESALALYRIATAPREGPGAVDPERIAHAQQLIGWTDASGQTTGTPERPENLDTAEEFQGRVRRESIEDNFRRQEERAEAKRIEDKRLRDEAQREFLDNQEREYDAIKQSRAEARADRMRIAAEARELGNQKLETGRWWREAGTGQKILAVLGGIAGGLGAARSGAKKSLALESINKMIDDDVELQKAEIANKRAALGDESRTLAERMQDAEADHREGELRRQANYQIVRNNIAEQMQEWDQRGATAQRFRDAMQQVDRDAYAAMDKAEAEAHKRKLELRRLGIDEDKLKLDQKKHADALAAKAAKGDGAGVKQTPAYWEAYSGGKRPPHDMTPKEFATWLATAKHVKDLDKPEGSRTPAQQRKDEAEATKAEAEAAAAEGGFAINNPESGNTLVMKNGRPFVVMNDARRQKVQDIADAAVNIRKFSDKIAEVRERTGGASQYLSPSDYKELQSLATAIDFETFVGFGLGAPSEGDKDLAEKIKGGDMTSWISDPKKGLETYAQSVESKANTHFRGAGYDGNYVRFHRRADLGKAKDTLVDDLGRKLTTALALAPIDTNDPVLKQQQKVIQALTATQTKETDEQLQQLGAYAEFNPDLQQRKLARTYLEGLAKSAVYPVVRDKVKKILADLPGGDERSGEAR